MTHLLRLSAPLVLSLSLLAGCSSTDNFNPFRKAPAENTALKAPVGNTAQAIATGGRSAAALDQSSSSERAAALSAPKDSSLERSLGQVQVSLGLATEPGFWLRSDLVSQPKQGRVVTALGQSLQVDLLPGSGAPQLSLSAFRSLNLPLTGLPVVTVWQR